MRLSLLISLFCLFVSCVLSQDAEGISKQKHDYQSDVTRLRKIVINSLYSHRDIFLRELLSNANDALEKLRLTSLTEKTLVDPEHPFNITIKAVKDEGSGGRIIITDYGIGMTSEELATNLGTLAKSGTSEFLEKAESTDGTGQGNLIGAFGLGFYSSFLVASRVYVASVPSSSGNALPPVQYVFSSSADDSSFEVYPDPRGNTLGRGTEITLVLKEDAIEYLEIDKLKQLVQKHSAFSSAYPIYLYTTKTEEVPDVDETETASKEVPSASVDQTTSSTAETPSTKPSESTSTNAEENAKEEMISSSAVETISAKPSDSTSTDSEPTLKDEDEAVVEDVEDAKAKKEEEKEKPQKMKSVTTEEWVHLNAQAPIWSRDPKNVTDEEYIDFYKATFKDVDAPLAWHHFSGDSGAGSSFKAILFIPPQLPHEFWQGPSITSKDIRLLNKRVFVTNELGESPLPKWVSWLKAIVDADDLPLNVSRETLQSSRFLKQIKQILIRRLIQLLERISEEDPAKYESIVNVFGSAIKLGAIDGEKDRQRLAGLARWTSNQRNFTSLENYVNDRKKGQTQIFFHAGVGQKPEVLAKSLFIEKLTARGYEVLLASEPLDEILYQTLRVWKTLAFQDAAKTGLKFGDEDEDSEDEKEKNKNLVQKFKPLTEWLKNETADVVMDVTLSNRLVTSPCAIVASMFGYSASMEKLMNSQNTKRLQHEYAKKQKNLEINPNSPLIEGLLRRVEQLPADEDERDIEAEAELREVTAILVDGALIRSGFEVTDANIFFERVDRVLRRSLGVSESAKADATVKPAPPVETEPLAPPPDGPTMPIQLPEHLKGKISVDMEEMGPEEDENSPFHDEL